MVFVVVVVVVVVVDSMGSGPVEAIVVGDGRVGARISWDIVE